MSTSIFGSQTVNLRFSSPPTLSPSSYGKSQFTVLRSIDVALLKERLCTGCQPTVLAIVKQGLTNQASTMHKSQNTFRLKFALLTSSRHLEGSTSKKKRARKSNISHIKSYNVTYAILSNSGMSQRPERRADMSRLTLIAI